MYQTTEAGAPAVHAWPARADGVAMPPAPRDGHAVRAGGRSAAPAAAAPSRCLFCRYRGLTPGAKEQGDD